MSSWTKSLGELADERKGAKTREPVRKRCKPVVFGRKKTGVLELKRDGRLPYNDSSPGKATRFLADEIQKAGIEGGAERQRRSTIACTGGGVVAGGLLLGPAGLLAGLGLGAVAKKESVGEKFLVLDLDDERTVFAPVTRKHLKQAHELLHKIKPKD